MNKFKVGDKVYCPMYSTSVLTVARNKSGYHSDIYPLAIAVGRNYDTLANDGKIRNGDKQPILFHATPENHKALEQLYGVEFEKPPVKPMTHAQAKQSQNYQKENTMNEEFKADVAAPAIQQIRQKLLGVTEIDENPSSSIEELIRGLEKLVKSITENTSSDHNTNEAITELPE